MQTTCLIPCFPLPVSALMRAMAAVLVLSAAPCALAATTANTKVEPVPGRNNFATSQDSQTSATNERVEAFSQGTDRFGRRIEASALAEGNGNLEVGVGRQSSEVMSSQGFASAHLEIPLDLTAKAVGLTMKPGGIFFLTFEPGRTPGVGNRGFLSASLTMFVNGQPESQLFTYLLSLSSTDTGFEIDPTTTDNARASIVLQELGASGIWGVETGAVTFPITDLLLTRNALDEVVLRYDMEAFVRITIPDRARAEAAIGDPLDGIGGGSLTIITDDDPPPAVPEPGTLALLAASLVAARSRRILRSVRTTARTTARKTRLL